MDPVKEEQDLKNEIAENKSRILQGQHIPSGLPADYFGPVPPPGENMAAPQGSSNSSLSGPSEVNAQQPVPGPMVKQTSSLYDDYLDLERVKQAAKEQALKQAETEERKKTTTTSPGT